MSAVCSSALKKMYFRNVWLFLRESVEAVSQLKGQYL